MNIEEELDIILLEAREEARSRLDSEDNRRVWEEFKDRLRKVLTNYYVQKDRVNRLHSYSLEVPNNATIWQYNKMAEFLENSGFKITAKSKTFIDFKEYVA